MPDASSEIIAANLTRDAALLEDVVREAGALALKLFRTELKSWIKGKSSPVSEADIAVNDLIETRLRSATPGYGWLSEESADDTSRIGKSLTWIVDPIDGTRAYLERREDWSVSIALVANGLPVLGAVFAPASNEFFFATRGDGALLNGARVTAAPGSAINFPKIAGPKPLVERLGGMKEGESLYPRIGSLALRLVKVAEGRLDAAFAAGNSRDWDLAAADLIVHEAGGEMTSLAGERLVYNLADVRHGLLVAAGHARHAHIVKHFRENPIPW
ncbi:MAG: 3'(2'),5'-bisphosphate nucleotidase CysQ [Afipia sp.]|nr:3'(2'),5'-bisphosphate nucleotidase CysQ [Afipia sp.]